MYYNQYKLLHSNWKIHFDFLSLKKTDHKDLSPFKLAYNEKLFLTLLEDQKKKRDRGKDKYEEMARNLFDKIEKERFVRNKEGISLHSMKGAIQESDIVTGIHLQEIGEHKYPILMVKCYLSTMTLNDDEVTFLTTALPCHLDQDSCGITIAVASIPIMKKSSTQKEEMIFRWAIKKSIDQLEAYYAKVFNTENPKRPLIERVKGKLLDIQIKYFL